MNTETTTTQTPVIDLVAEIAELHATKRARRWLSQKRTASRGDVCIAAIAFTDQSSFKVRPALVVGLQRENLVVVPITTQAPRDGFDVDISFHTRSGLRGPRIARCSMISSVARSAVFRIAGHLVAEDWQRITETIEAWVKHTVVGGSTKGKLQAR